MKKINKEKFQKQRNKNCGDSLLHYDYGYAPSTKKS